MKLKPIKLLSLQKRLLLPAAVAALSHPAVLAAPATANPPLEDLFSLSLEELMNVKVVSASARQERMSDAPASMVVISAKDIQQRGYTSLDQIFADLPGFDYKDYAGNTRSNNYQRGYRTPFTQRTLLMINGNVENDLWSHVAHISRQYPLSGIEQIEVLYGPAGAVYGPNAFLGVVNIITKDPTKLSDDFLTLDVQLGSFATRSVELSAGGHLGEISYVVSGKIYRSDEAAPDDYSAEWGYLGEPWVGNAEVWGDILQDIPHTGQYTNPSDDWGLMGEAAYGQFKAGLVSWQMSEGYGPYYANDRVQPGTLWNKSGQQWYLRHQQQWLNTAFTAQSQLLYRRNRIWGGWAEAEPDWNLSESAAHASYISFTNWNSINHSWQFKQDYDYQLTDKTKLQGGIKYERKRLTKAYDVCAYWEGSFCSTDNTAPESWPIDPYGDSWGPGIFHSTDPAFAIAPPPAEQMPGDNIAYTTDKGIYLQTVWDNAKWRLNGGIRYDDNSLYGGTINPRVSAIYRLNERTTIKALYGTAFQEPAPAQLWGGWIGRRANPDLQPEKARNIELVLMYQADNVLHDISLFRANYHNVIKEEAENAGERRVSGFEYRARVSMRNVLADAADITGYAYYTWTKTRSSISYNHQLNEWQNSSTDVGDIAPHKLNIGLNVPLTDRWNLNIRGNYVSAMPVYTRNALRANNTETDAYIVTHLNLRYDAAPFSIAFRVMNLFDTSYWYTGPEQGDSGNDFTRRSQGYRSSLIPAVGRSYQLSFGARF